MAIFMKKIRIIIACGQDFLVILFGLTKSSSTLSPYCFVNFETFNTFCESSFKFFQNIVYFQKQYFILYKNKCRLSRQDNLPGICNLRDNTQQRRENKLTLKLCQAQVQLNLIFQSLVQVKQMKLRCKFDEVRCNLDELRCNLD